MNRGKILLLTILIITSFILIYTFPVPAQKLDDETSLKIEEYLSTGKSLYRQDKFRKAIAIWKKVLEIDPANGQAQRYIERAEERLHELQPEELPAEPRAEEPAAPAEKIIPEIKPFTPPALEFIPLAEKAQRILSLKDCIHTAIDNSISLNTAKREIKLAKQKVKDAWRALFPAASVKWEEISGTTTGEDFKGREFYLELQQPLYQGGRLVNTLKQARVNMQVARHNYQKLKNDLVYEVEQAFHILASTKKTFRELLELITLAKKDYSVAEKEIDLQLQREIDFLNVKNLYQETEYKLLSSQKDLALAYLTLYQTLNIDSKKQSIDIPEPPPPKILEIVMDNCQKIAMENRPDLRIKDLLLRFNKYGLQIAGSGNRLKVDLTAAGGYKDEVFITEDLDLQTEWYVGLKGSIPIWLNTAEYSFISQDKVPSAGQTTSTEYQSHTATLRLFDNTAYTGITEARVNLEKAKDELQKLEKSVSFEVKQDYYEYEKAVYQLSNSSIKLKLSEVELAIVAAQRDLNLATTNDLLRTRIKLWEAKTGYHQATAGYFTSIAKLNKTIGVSGYFNPMGEPSAESAYTISPPPLDISLAKLDITPVHAEEPVYQKPAAQLSAVEETVQPQEVQTEEPSQNFGPRNIDESPQEETTKEKVKEEKKEEEKRLAQLKKEEKSRKKEEERKRLAEEKEKKRLLEQRKREEERRLAQQKKEEERKRREEEKRLAQLKKEEEKRKQDEEKGRLAEEKEKKRLLEQRKREEERRLAQQKKEEERKRREEEKRLAQLKKGEEKRKQEEEKKRLAEEKEKKRLLEQRKREEERRLAQLKKEAERKKQEEERQRLAKEKEQKRLEKELRIEKERYLAQLKEEGEQKKREEEKQRLALEREQKEIAERIRKEQEEILARLKEEEKERKQLAQLKSPKESTLVVESGPDEYARAKLLAVEIVKRKAEEKKNLQLIEKEEEERKRREEEMRREEERRLAQQKKEDEKKRSAEEQVQKEAEKLSLPAPVESKPTEYELAVKDAGERLLQLEQEKSALVAKLQDKQASRKAELDKYLLQAEGYYKNKEYAPAIKEWYKALALDIANKEAQEGIHRAEEELRKTK